MDAPLTTGKPIAPQTDVLADGEIVAAIIGGDRSAYALLVRRYERAVRATTLRILHDTHLADDAAQEAFVAAYESLGKLRDPSAFGAWLLTIARQRAIRAAKKLRATEPLNDVVPAHRIDNETESVLAAISTLPEHERVIVMLRYFEDHDVATIARILDRPIGTITKQLSRAHERLRISLRKEDLR